MPGDPIYIDGKAVRDKNTYDAIVIGSGISGGWAAKELCEKGLKTLVLERGRNVDFKDYANSTKAPWERERYGAPSLKERTDNPVQSSIYAWNDVSKDFFVSDKEHPYIQVQPFGWIRGYQVGGRSLVWGRQSYRLSDLDFEANKQDGFGTDWPIRYKDIAPWYSYVEKFVGVSGAAENMPQLPDGEFLPPMEMNCLERKVADSINAFYHDRRRLIMGRVANLTRPIQKRGPCQYRNKCHEGCPFSGYFSSNAATLPAAAQTGNLTLRPFSIVKEILFDADHKKATGVRIIDTDTLKTEEFYAKIIFVNASTIATAAILLNSVSNKFPLGLGNNYNIVGHYLINHHVGAGANGTYEGLEDKYYYGRRPNGPYMPRFRNLDEKTKTSKYLRGFAYQCSAEREGFNRQMPGFTIGADFKDALTEPGSWTMSMSGFGEVLPYYENKISLDPILKDKWGLPLVAIDCSIKDNEKQMRMDMTASAAEMLEKSGFINVKVFDRALDPKARVLSVHEMGTARMGNDPKTSVVNKFNQVHEARNVFITDGACMSSSACQNPSLTYMALTARACDFAVSELKKRNL